MEIINYLNIEDKISALENKYAKLFESNASKESLFAIWQQIRFLKALNTNEE